MFGVMFGDIGHGSLLLIVGILLCVLNQKMKIEATGAIRYLILLMGIFALFNGFIYNEFFAIPLNIFESCYDKYVHVLAVNEFKNSTAQYDEIT